MRLFIAIELPKEHRNYLDNLGNSLKTDSAIITPAKEHHLTLKFLGDYPDNKIHELKDRLSKISFSSFDANFDSIGVFPNENNIRVVWVGLAPIAPFVALERQIDEVTTEVNKDREFVPHITLVRVKSMKGKAFGDKVKLIKVEAMNFKVDAFKLIKSTLTPKGPIYEVLGRFTAKAL